MADNAVVVTETDATAAEEPSRTTSLGETVQLNCGGAPAEERFTGLLNCPAGDPETK